jgi:hypothetical protein
MPLGQPLTDIGRHQERLLAIARDEALAHRDMVLNPPDDTPTYATASGKGSCVLAAVAVHHGARCMGKRAFLGESLMPLPPDCLALAKLTWNRWAEIRSW